MGTSASFCKYKGGHVSDHEREYNLGPHKCVADRVGERDFSEVYNQDLKAAGRRLNGVLQNGLPSLPENARRLYTAKQSERRAAIKLTENSCSDLGSHFLSPEKLMKMNREMRSVTSSLLKKEFIDSDDEIDQVTDISEKYIPESELDDSHPAVKRYVDSLESPNQELANARKNHEKVEDEVADIVYGFRRDMQGLLNSLHRNHLDSRDSSNELNCVKSLFNKLIERVVEKK